MTEQAKDYERRPLRHAAAALRRLADAIADTHIDFEDRTRLRMSLDELCHHRPDLRRACERAFSIANTCTIPMHTAERRDVMAKLKEMINALVEACSAR